MKNKKIVIGIVVVVLVLGIILIKSPGILKMQAKMPARKPFSKNMGGLTVKVKDVNKKDMYLRVNAYKTVDRQSDVYAATFTSNRMQELLPGSYDVQIETTPSMLYKGIDVYKDKETATDLGTIMGALLIKAVDENNKEARVSARIKKSDTGEIVTTTITNRPVEILKGTYTVELFSSPAQIKKDVAIDAGNLSTVEFTVQAPITPVRAQVPVRAPIKK